MWSRALLLRLLGVVPLVGGACQGDCPPPDLKYLPIESGAYRTVAEVGEVKRAVIDRQAGTATFTFQSRGKQVTEVWRITARTLR